MLLREFPLTHTDPTSAAIWKSTSSQSPDISCDVTWQELDSSGVGNEMNANSRSSPPPKVLAYFPIRKLQCSLGSVTVSDCSGRDTLINSWLRSPLLTSWRLENTRGQQKCPSELLFVFKLCWQERRSFKCSLSSKIVSVNLRMIYIAATPQPR